MEFGGDERARAEYDEFCFMAVSFQLMESENARAALDGVRLAFSA